MSNGLKLTFTVDGSQEEYTHFLLAGSQAAEQYTFEQARQLIVSSASSSYSSMTTSAQDYIAQNIYPFEDLTQIALVLESVEVL